MKKKFLGSLIAIAFSLLSIFGYQWATNGSPPDVEKFLIGDLQSKRNRCNHNRPNR